MSSSQSEPAQRWRLAGATRREPVAHRWDGLGEGGLPPNRGTGAQRISHSGSAAAMGEPHKVVEQPAAAGGTRLPRGWGPSLRARIQREALWSRQVQRAATPPGQVGPAAFHATTHGEATQCSPHTQRGSSRRSRSWPGVSVGFCGILGAEPRRIGDGLGCEATPGPRIPSLETSKGRSLTMLWTILVILVIVALAIFIFKRVRG